MLTGTMVNTKEELVDKKMQFLSNRRWFETGHRRFCFLDETFVQK